MDLHRDRAEGHDRAEGLDGGDRLAGHPDLRALSRRLRTEMDDTLRAEQHAARVAAQRRSTIRDRLVRAEDRHESLQINVVGGAEIRGKVIAVGADHVVIGRDELECWVALQHVVVMRAAR